MDLIRKLHKYSLEQLTTAIKTSTSMRQTLIKVNVEPYGGNYDVLRKAIKHFGLDTRHFTEVKIVIRVYNNGLLRFTRNDNNGNDRTGLFY